jgi:tetratricopeptide (TPR) repeat protein
MNEEDEENPLGDNWEYGAPFIEEEDLEDLEFCPFCGDFVETIDGACVECGKKIPVHGVAKSVGRLKKKTAPELAQHCYHKGKKLFYIGKSGEDWFRKAIAFDPESYWGYFSYYYLGREDLKNGDLTGAENNFRTSLSGISDAAWPHYYLGKTLLQKDEFSEAEREFEKALEADNTIEPAKTYIDEIKLRKTKLEFPKKVRDVENLTENVMLENHALIEWFEINIREFVKTVLEEKYGEKMWWRKGVPASVRKNCALRKEESPEEEMDCSELSFSQFYNYAEIIGANKSVFSTFINIREWIHKLNELEHIRNGIMHCRGRHLSNKRNSLLKKWCYELEGIMNKITKNSNK